MAAEQMVWGVEIGQCALKAIRLRYDPEKKKAEALAFDYIEHPKILSQPDADPEALTREALATFLSRNKLKGETVVIGVPGQTGLCRFIKLPPVEQKKIPEIVRYEARQQIPFALEEVIWQFQKVGKSEEAEGFSLETEIGLFAMKRDQVARYLAPYQEAGVEVHIIQMRPLAVYNFACFDLLKTDLEGESAEGTGDEKEETQGEQSQREELVEKAAKSDLAGGSVVLLEMGADTSDLVITDGIKIWQRSLPIGGNHFTRALTKELKLTFAKAEHLKRNAIKAQDPRAIFQAMRPVFNDFVSEIQRSIGYFSSVHRQAKIAKIVGLGNAFKLPGLQKFLAQNLQYEVEKLESFARLSGDAVLASPVFQENLLGYGVAVGLALQGLRRCPLGTSLLPPEIERARVIRRKKPWALTAAAALMVGFTFLFVGNWKVLNAVHETRYASQEQKGNSVIKTASDYKSQFDSAKGEWNTVKGAGETLTSNVTGRLEWLEILKIINGVLPQNPASDANPKKIPDRKDVQIEEVAVTYENVAEWYPKQSREMTRLTRLLLDEQSPPTGETWLFTLTGHHFQPAGEKDTINNLLYPMQESAELRVAGITHITLTENYQDKNWWPGKGEREGGRRSGGGSPFGNMGGGGGGYGGGMAGGLTEGASMSSGGGGGRGGGGMGAMLGGGAGMGAAGDQPSGDSAGGGLGRGGLGGMGSRGDEDGDAASGAGFLAGGGAGGEGAGAEEQPATAEKVTTVLPRTNFIIQFVWTPVAEPERTKEKLEEAKKKIEDAVQEAIKKNTRPKELDKAVLERERKLTEEAEKRRAADAKKAETEKSPAPGAGSTPPGAAPQTPPGQPAPATPGQPAGGVTPPVGAPGFAPSQPPTPKDK
jgi:type IV pilus assembly protein PilM